jgi:hypothetical protein
MTKNLTIYQAKNGAIELKTNSSKGIYETDEQGERKLDKHNHLIQKHDLHKIANAFEIWAKEHKLSFWG